MTDLLPSSHNGAATALRIRISTKLNAFALTKVNLFLLWLLNFVCVNFRRQIPDHLVNPDPCVSEWMIRMV
jgi:hypothetical protein